MPRQHRPFTPVRLAGLGAAVVLLVAMVLSTRFLTPEQLAAVGPQQFDPRATAADLFTRAKAELPAAAAPLDKVLPALQSDPEAAATTYEAIAVGESAYVFPVTTSATVTDASAANLRLEVPGAPAQTPVIVPLGTAINGTVLRDAMGFKFADAPGQTDYQYVGDELKKLIQADLRSSVADPTDLSGKKVDVVGLIALPDAGSPVPEAKPINVQPLSVEAGA